MAHTYKNQKEDLQVSSLWVGELELHQDTDEKSAGHQRRLFSAAEGTAREGDGRLAGKYTEEARTRAVLENLRDIASRRVPRWSNVDQQQMEFPQPLPCPQSCLCQKTLSKGREVYSETQQHNGTRQRFGASRARGWGRQVLHLAPPKSLIWLMVHRPGYKHLHQAF